MRSALFLLLTALSLHAQTPPPTLRLDLGAGVSLEMMLVRAGTFQMGSTAPEVGREPDEGPLRSVTLTSDFYIGKYPVTRGQFAAFARSTSFRTEAEKGQSGGFGVENGKLVQKKFYSWKNAGFPQTDEHPVVIVSAEDAQFFCQWIERKTRRACSLPTEAQWEYACRAGSAGALYAEPVNEVAWFRANSDGQTYPVGQKKPNAWGLYDCYGPVWQWCADWYAPYSSGSSTDPLQRNRNLSDKPRMVLRGGSCLSDVSHSRSAERYRNDPRSRNADNGFRIVCSVVERPKLVSTASKTKTMTPRSTIASQSASTVSPSPTSFPRTQPSSSRSHSYASSSGPSGGGLGIFSLLPLGGVALVAYKFLKSMGGFSGGHRAGLDALSPDEVADHFGNGPPPLPQRFSFRMADSGFYIIGPAEAVGDVIEYTADIGSRVIVDQVTFTPGPEGQFIFTGERPHSVRVQTTGGQRLIHPGGRHARGAACRLLSR
ncbi:MAG: SUMF1/EgtB/PvdO family nonheme iron enzyme [Verrucomicrobiaceae bacterium]|nr:SUMF1/EgtB/PvdO family nonheme iron enzyme [Verrucomicrobiaceae bacterium]